ncbi:MAG: MFS transporter [Alteromonadaceae bacterium]|nr:MAG: MFS transporter [Alteromonadaceae bacterium]
MYQYLRFYLSSWPLVSFGFLCFFWGSFGQSFFVSWFGQDIQDSLGISASVYGGIYSAATLLGSVLMLAGGALIDRWPLWRFTLTAAVGLMLACVILANTYSVYVLFFGLFFLRLFGQGVLPHTAQTTMARYFDADRGKAISLAANGVPAGLMLFPLSLVVLIGAVGWRNSWWFLAISIAVIFLPLSYYLLRKSAVDVTLAPSTKQEGKSASGGRGEMLRDYRFWLALPTLIASPVILTGIVIHQGFLLEQKNWGALDFAGAFVVSGAVNWCSAMLAGILIDRFNARMLLGLLLIPLLLAMLVGAYLQGVWVIYLFMGLLGMSTGLTSPTIGALWAEVYGTAKLGSVRSLYSACVMSSSSLSPGLFGILIDQGVSLRSLLAWLAVAVFVGILMAHFSYRRE